jgi:hypothetical protein
MRYNLIMAKVIKRNYSKDGDESYFVRRLYLPDYYRIVNEEMKLPNSWASNSMAITRDEEVIFKMKKGELDNYYDKINYSLSSNHNLQKILLDLIGYTHKMKPEMYNHDKKKSSVGYRGYGGYWGGSESPKPKLPAEKLIENRYENFVTKPTLVSAEIGLDDDGDSLTKTYIPGGYRGYGTNPLGQKITAVAYSPGKIIQPILNELKLLNRTAWSPILFQNYKYEDIDDGVKEYIRQAVRGYMSSGYVDEDAKTVEAENLINSPLLSSNFYANMNSIQIPWRPYHRYVNRFNEGEFENCVIPGLKPFNIDLPSEPFILIINQTDVEDIFDNSNETIIYLMIGDISKEDYNANVKKPKGGKFWWKGHGFKKGKILEKKGRTLSNKIYAGLKILLNNNQTDITNHFGPIENTIHPNRLRELIREYNDENETEEEYNTRNLNFQYKIIKLKDVEPKIVNWPRSKPIKSESEI